MMNRYEKGFRPQLSDEIREKVKAFGITCLPCRIIEAISYHLSIILIAVSVYLAVLYSPWWLVTVSYLLSLVLIARQQRVIELFVHDASHYSWHQRNKRWNNLVANLLVAWPTFTTVEDYRRFHLQHHAYYGIDGMDPCKRRFAMFGKSNLVAYMLDWYREVGSKDRSLLAKWAAWHLAVYILPAELVLGGGLGFGLWIAFWLLPMLTILPALRRIAEAEEHDYDRATTEFTTTYTNLGWFHRALIHPAGDAYHLLHHLWPSIPMSQHKKVHRFLMEHVPEYQGGLIRIKVLKKH